MKIKKQHRKKKFHHTYNRKRMNKKLSSTGNVKCKVIDSAWDHRKSTLRNLTEMGLANDPNKVLKIPNFKARQLRMAKTMVHPESEQEQSDGEVPVVAKREVVEILEKQARAPRERRFMLPKGQVDFITYLLDKYGHDYKAMAKDKKNYYQETWRQLRAKIKTFMGIPKQYGEYLKSRGLIEKEEDEEELQIQARAMAMDDSD